MAVSTTCKAYEPSDSDWIVIRQGHSRVETRFGRVRLANLAMAGHSDGLLRLIIENDGLTRQEVLDVLRRREAKKEAQDSNPTSRQR